MEHKTYFKTPTWRSRDWLSVVHRIPCVTCGYHEVQAAHANRGKAKGMKTSDATAAALCMRCHVEIDSGTSLVRAQRRALHDEALVSTFAQLLMHGYVKVCDVDAQAFHEAALDALEASDYELCAKLVVHLIESGQATINKAKAA